MHMVDRPNGPYDAIIVGSGFAAAFFLHRYLSHAGPSARVLVLERGRLMSHSEQVLRRVNSDLPQHTTWQKRGRPDKDWNFTLGFGGSSNCWWGNTPRPHPNDFKLKSLYGVGRDWPISYDDIETYLGEVEEIMEISGPNEALPWPKSRPYPLPAHRLTLPDKLLMQAYPGQHISIPTARPSRPAKSRPQCCVNGVCNLCPIDSKFTLLNSFMAPFEDPRVSVMLGAEVRSVDSTGGRATGVVYRTNGRDERVSGDLVVLAAHAIFNPVILMRSGLTHPQLGRNLHEQLAIHGEVLLRGLDHFQGSTVTTALNYSQYDGAFRATQASVLVEIWNIGQFRSEPDRWLQVMPFMMKFEDLPELRNRVELDATDPDRPLVIFENYSDYALRTYARARAIAEKIFEPLPVEDIRIDPEPVSTSSHIHGTTIMGNDPSSSIVDRFQIHHGVRNLVVLGSGNFPSGSQTNPTLILSALAMRTADKIGGST